MSALHRASRVIDNRQTPADQRSVGEERSLSSEKEQSASERESRSRSTLTHQSEQSLSKSRSGSSSLNRSSIQQRDSPSLPHPRRSSQGESRLLRSDRDHPKPSQLLGRITLSKSSERDQLTHRRSGHQAGLGLLARQVHKLIISSDHISQSRLNSSREFGGVPRGRTSNTQSGSSSFRRPPKNSGTAIPGGKNRKASHTRSPRKAPPGKKYH